MPSLGPDGGVGPLGSMTKTSFCVVLGTDTVAVVSIDLTTELSFEDPNLRPRAAADWWKERRRRRRTERSMTGFVLTAMPEEEEEEEAAVSL